MTTATRIIRSCHSLIILIRVVLSNSIRILNWSTINTYANIIYLAILIVGAPGSIAWFGALWSCAFSCVYYAAEIAPLIGAVAVVSTTGVVFACCGFVYSVVVSAVVSIVIASIDSTAVVVALVVAAVGHVAASVEVFICSHCC